MINGIPFRKYKGYGFFEKHKSFSYMKYASTKISFVYKKDVIPTFDNSFFTTI